MRRSYYDEWGSGLSKQVSSHPMVLSVVLYLNGNNGITIYTFLLTYDANENKNRHNRPSWQVPNMDLELLKMETTALQ
jgi:hypothetical protein